MDCEGQGKLLRELQEMEFVAVELNLYLDTHPCDEQAINDYNCAVKVVQRLVKEYEEKYGPLLNFGMGGTSECPWQWVEEPWPWEM